MFNGIKTPTLPAIKQKNSFIYELIEFVELVDLDIYECLNCFINSKCRDEQVGGIERIPRLLLFHIIVYELLIFKLFENPLEEIVGLNWLDDIRYHVY